MPSKTTRRSVNLDDNASVIVLKVLISGKRDRRLLKMVLDTGASITTIPAEAAIAIGCDPSRPAERIEMITASGVEYVPVVVIPKLKFLGFELKKLKAACLNLPPKGLVSGLLGLNVLKDFDILLALRRKLLEVSE